MGIYNADHFCCTRLSSRVESLQVSSLLTSNLDAPAPSPAGDASHQQARAGREGHERAWIIHPPDSQARLRVLRRLAVLYEPPHLHLQPRRATCTQQPSCRVHCEAAAVEGADYSRILQYVGCNFFRLHELIRVRHIVNNRDKVVGLKGYEVTQIEQKVQLLLDSSGAKIVPLKRKTVVSVTESARGIWSGFHTPEPYRI